MNSVTTLARLRAARVCCRSLTCRRPSPSSVSLPLPLLLKWLADGCLTRVHYRSSITTAPRLACRFSGARFSAVIKTCALVEAARCMSTASPHTSPSSATADELRSALRILGLKDNCNDAEVKKAFQAFAKQHHPDLQKRVGDVVGSCTSTNEGGGGGGNNEAASAVAAAERMRLGTEAYQLLREIPAEERHRILREGERHYRGPHDSDFEFTKEAYAKAQRVYEGDRQRRRRRENGSSSWATTEENLFDTRSEEGRRRTARLNEFQARILEMRRRGQRDDLPPWRVHPSHSTSNGSGSQDSSQGRSRASSSGGVRGDRARPSAWLGLHFFQSTASQLREVRDLYRSRPGFAGMDGSSYDNPNSAARVAPELQANPHLRQYILMKHRAQEKAIVDKAVRRPLILFLLFVCCVATVLVLLATIRSYRARAQEDAERQRRDTERGGA